MKTKKIATVKPTLVYEYEIFFSCTTKAGHFKIKTKTIRQVDEEHAIKVFNTWKDRQKSMTDILMLGITDNKIPITINIANRM